MENFDSSLKFFNILKSSVQSTHVKSSIFISVFVF